MPSPTSPGPSSHPPPGKRFGFDGSEFPLVRLTCPSQPHPDDLAAYYRVYDEIWPRGPHVLLVDIRRLNPLFAGAIPRRALMNEVAKRQPLVGKLLVAEARMVSGSVVRGIVTAFEWLRPSPRTAPLYMCENEVEAFHWLRPFLESIRAQNAKP